MSFYLLGQDEKKQALINFRLERHLFLKLKNSANYEGLKLSEFIRKKLTEGLERAD